ncbi:hypothetical protein LCGC14_1813000 [marine sediment metagenome]|uniref:Uncharacterized protein n=1 Tax=marine sediment metagenome TaxID=412755 RepID=A0A0F9H993_9ZZZZ
MRKKVEIYRNRSGDYELYEKDGACLAGDLCGIIFKGWFGLKKHLRKGQKVEGYLTLNFKRDKKR